MAMKRISSELHERMVELQGLSIYAVEGGPVDQPAILFLHGWPENWSAFEPVMISMSKKAHVVAIDLPGVGNSRGVPSANDKRTLARLVRGVIEQLELQHVTLVGHDVGGQIVYAFLHTYPNELERAVMMNIVVPGVDPWDEVERNPQIWHFAFHSVPDLPEILVTGHEGPYFDFFFERLAGPNGITKERREIYTDAYSRPQALHTGFEWYRAFPRDKEDNLQVRGKTVDVPVLYLRGDHESGDLETYLKGLREGGLWNVRGQVIPNSGHFAPDEQPDEVVRVLCEFVETPVTSRRQR
jgi:pimeloyl-ACP methyl ester carboxylesterase